MKKSQIIKKWLNYELSPEEIKTFEASSDYEDLTKLSHALTHFKAPEYRSGIEYNTLQNKKALTKKAYYWYSPLWKIAAVLVFCFSIYHYAQNQDTTIDTLTAQKTALALPDTSEVMLNASSSITYNKALWEDNREVSLKGEAYFKVAKGSTFTVLTKDSKVTVLGTQFNIKKHDNLFEVVCYEGAVNVNYKSNNTVTLNKGNRFLIIDGKLIASEKETNLDPSWINNESYFKSMPFEYVLKEFERQYSVTFKLKDINTSQLFTGNFVHNNFELALKSITLPLNITYYKEADRYIVLMRE